MEHKPIYLDGVDVSECEYVCNTAFGNIGCKLPFNEEIHCCNIPNCYYKQIQKEKFENLNNRQMVESAENLIYENSELIKNLEEKEQKCEELKKEIINKNEKIKELRFSVSDLTNRLCYLNAEKSFRIVDLEQALNEIEKYQKRNCETCSFYKTDKCGISCQTFVILNIINKAKDGEK